MSDPWTDTCPPDVWFNGDPDIRRGEREPRQMPETCEGLQVIGTRVADDETCTVVIEDGRVRGAGPDEEPEEPRTECKEI